MLYPPRVKFGKVLYLIYAVKIANVTHENLCIYGYADYYALSASFKPYHQGHEGNEQLQGIILAGWIAID